MICKRPVSVLLSLFVILSTFTISVHADNQTTRYVDVPESHWAYSYIIHMTDLDIFHGTGVTSDGTPVFSPDAEMMRSEFVTALTRLLYPDELSTLPTGDKWYSSYYSLALRHGLLVADEFDGGILEKACTRQEMAMLMTRAAYSFSDEVAEEAIDISAIPDHNAIDPYYQTFVCQAYSLGLLAGVDQAGTFNPTATLSRAQAATVIYRLIDTSTRTKDNGTTVTYTWPDGITYKGAIKDGEANGYGEMVFPNIGTYRGGFVNGRREGIGTFSWLVGDTYVGQWNHDKQNGSGTYTFSDGFVIRGIWSDNKISASSFNMEPSTAVLGVGESIYLVAKVEPDMTTDSVSWSSSDSRVVEVKEARGNFCIVTSIKKGSATVTAKTSSGKVTTCDITVGDKVIPIRQLKLSQGDATINVSEKLTLIPTFAPSNPSDPSLTWTSSNSRVATVSSTGVVTAKERGTAIISAQTKSGIVATCYFTVVDPFSDLWEGDWTVYASTSQGSKSIEYGDCSIDASTMSADLYATGLFTRKETLDLIEENAYTLSAELCSNGYSYYFTFTSVDDTTIILEAEKIYDSNGNTRVYYYYLER